jgi:uncharacterized RDD family membrane protein YckC
MSADPNPYRPPSADLGTAAEPADAPLAGKGRRFGTLIVDYIGFYLLSMVIGIATGLIFGHRGIAFITAIPQLLVGVIVILAYYIVFEGAWGRTPGKFVFGTVVVDADGRKPPFAKIVKRSLCRLIPFEPFSFLGDRGWHDSIPDTRVVLVRGR